MVSGQMVNAVVNCAAFFLLLLLAVAGAMSGNLKQPIFRIFFALILFALAGMLTELLITLLAGRLSVAAGLAVRLADFMSYAFYAATAAAYILYLHRYLGAKTTLPHAPFRLALCLDGGAVVLAAVAAFTGIYARFDEMNRYIVQPTFWISQIFPLLVLFTCLAITLHYRGHLNRREQVCLCLYPIINILCILVETAVEDIWLSPLGIAVTAFLIYTNLQADMKETIRRQDEQLAENRIAIMLSQIQPHFLYNTLSAIDKLCTDNPKAHKAILTFAEYLRGNMDSLAQKELIPFEKELAHTRQYLWLETLRFEQRLQVQYDIQTEDFLLPVLTLQPIVENAVRYGVTKRREGGTVIIRTAQADGCHRITVSDDGVGFDPSAAIALGRSHTGLSNVKARLAAMCGGRLAIQSAPGAGTTVVIEIPL